MKFLTGLLKALRVGIEGAAAVVLSQVLGVFKCGPNPTDFCPAPSDISPTLWLGLAFVAVLGLNFALGKLPKPPDAVRLALAHWLGERLPFVYLPDWANGILARFMWSTPGFDVNLDRLTRN